METIQYNLPQDRIPRVWYNILPDLPAPLAPTLHPGTLQPIGPDDLAPETLAKMKADCYKFRAENAKDIEGREEQAGHDLWLTRNHHGAGYWDGDWPDAGERLTQACKKYPEVNLYVGDDGLIYC